MTYTYDICHVYLFWVIFPKAPGHDCAPTLYMETIQFFAYFYFCILFSWFFEIFIPYLLQLYSSIHNLILFCFIYSSPPPFETDSFYIFTMQAQISTSIRFMIFSSANWRASDKVYAYRLKLTHFISLTNDWFIVIRISINYNNNHCNTSFIT